jgi:hypothetical protein
MPVGEGKKNAYFGPPGRTRNCETGGVWVLYRGTAHVIGFPRNWCAQYALPLYSQRFFLVECKPSFLRISCSTLSPSHIRHLFGCLFKTGQITCHEQVFFSWLYLTMW